MKTEKLIAETNRIPGMYAQLNDKLVEFYDKECEDYFYAFPTDGLHIGYGISRMQHLKAVQTEEFILWGHLLEEYAKSTPKERGLSPTYIAFDGTGFFTEEECKRYDKKYTMIEKTEVALRDIKRMFDNAPDDFLAMFPKIELGQTRDLMEFDRRKELEDYAKTLGLEVSFSNYAAHVSLDWDIWYRDFEHILNGRYFATPAEEEAFRNKENQRLAKKAFRTKMVGLGVVILPRIQYVLGGKGKIVDIDENNSERFLINFLNADTKQEEEAFFTKSEMVIL